jgi:hypothetical protein
MGVIYQKANQFPWDARKELEKITHMSRDRTEPFALIYCNDNKNQNNPSKVHILGH